MLATNPIPQASCSCAGSYRPWAGGKPFFGFRRVFMDFVRWTEFLSNYSFLGCGFRGGRAVTHICSRNRRLYSRACRRASTMQNFDATHANFGTYRDAADYAVLIANRANSAIIPLHSNGLRSTHHVPGGRPSG